MNNEHTQERTEVGNINNNQSAVTALVVSYLELELLSPQASLEISVSLMVNLSVLQRRRSIDGVET
jgi:hypothetical protein